MSARLLTSESVRSSVGGDGPFAKGESFVETFSRRHAPQPLTALFAKAFSYLAHEGSIDGFRYKRIGSSLIFQARSGI